MGTASIDRPLSISAKKNARGFHTKISPKAWTGRHANHLWGCNQLGAARGCTRWDQELSTYPAAPLAFMHLQTICLSTFNRKLSRKIERVKLLHMFVGFYHVLPCFLGYPGYPSVPSRVSRRSKRIYQPRKWVKRCRRNSPGVLAGCVSKTWPLGLVGFRRAGERSGFHHPKMRISLGV